MLEITSPLGVLSKTTSISPTVSSSPLLRGSVSAPELIESDMSLAAHSLQCDCMCVCENISMRENVFVCVSVCVGMRMHVCE